MKRKHAPFVCDAVVGRVEVVDELHDGQGLVPFLAEIEARKVDRAIFARELVQRDIRQLVGGLASGRRRDEQVAVCAKKGTEIKSERKIWFMVRQSCAQTLSPHPALRSFSPPVVGDLRADVPRRLLGDVELRVVLRRVADFVEPVVEWSKWE